MGVTNGAGPGPSDWWGTIRAVRQIGSLWLADAPCKLQDMGGSVTGNEMETLFQELGAELLSRRVTGEIAIAGGAVMLLVVESRDATKDVGAYFGGGASAIREAAGRVATRHDLPPDWLNDGVKGFFYGTPPQVLWREFPGLRVYAVRPDYVFAMKAVAGHPSDGEDLRALIHHLRLESPEDAMDLVIRYVPRRLIGPHVQYLIESLYEGEGS